MTRLYRWWPSYRPGIAEYDGRRVFVPTLVAEILFCGVLCLPVVQRFTGVPAAWILGLLAVHAAAGWVSSFPLHRASRRSELAFHALLISDLVFNMGGCLALVAVSGDPRSPFWLAVFLYGAARGASRDLEPSRVYLAAMLLGPLTVIPALLASGASVTAAVAMPVLSGMFAAFCYHILAYNGATWRQQQAETEAVLERLRERTAKLERDQLARDLHDSVGSALTLFRLYSDVIERKLDRPDELGAVARSMRAAASESIADLRSLLDALTPANGDDGAEATPETLRRIAGRFADASGADIEVDASDVTLAGASGAVRIALARVLQEALHNAVRHGGAGAVRVVLREAEEELTLEITDDGCGFSEAEVEVGRGLASMRRRLSELGGRFELESAPGSGTTVRVTVPVGISRRPAA